ncbi:uncharacterized protein [Henckelia pumila]|uniref:uncharacterized protein n=1 Tax=Henckelia pumila TaxID=405737 RepID=UPI003C6E0C40
MVQQNQFNVSAIADPHLQLRTFLKITDTGPDKELVQSLPLGSITTWEEMTVKFLAKYFPPSISTQLKIEINWEQIEWFYNGLNTPTRISVGFASRGTIFSKDPIQDYDMLEKMTINGFQWPSEHMEVKKSVVAYAVDPLTSISAHLSTLMTQVDALNKVNVADSSGVSVAIEKSHFPKQAQYINQSGYGGYRGNPEYGKRMARTESCLDCLETHVVNIGAMMKSMETQIGKLANALKDNNRGQFPSNTKVNPIEHCKAIELRSEKEVGVNESKAEVEEEKNVEETEVGDRKSDESKHMESKGESEEKPMFKPKLPYPQRFKKKALDEQFSKFLEIFKRLHINIPFVDALMQMPNYAKFLKELMSKKRKLEELETVNLTKECRANINLMPLSVFRSSGLGEVKPTTIALQLADRSIKYPRGIIEDVLVKIEKFIFPADFVVLDMEEDDNIPLIFGRPFLATADAKIDVKKGELSIGVEGEKVIFNVFKEANNPSTEKVFMIEESKKMESCRADVSCETQFLII